MTRSCPCCGSLTTKAVFRSPPLPVAGTRLYRSRAAALTAPMRAIDLAGCETCGFAWNASFNAEGLDYDSEYEGAQSRSQLFSTYLDTLAQGWLARASKPNPSILEVGCGQGEFLSALERCGATDLHGYDPAYRGQNGDGATIHTEPLPAIPTRRFDLVVNRMTLEHIPDPAAFLERMTGWIADGGHLITQVPAGTDLLHQRGISDLVYEHVNYFSQAALYAVLQRSMSGVSQIGVDFGGQHLTAVASRDSASRRTDASTPLPDFDLIREKLSTQLETWPTSLRRLTNAHDEVWLWGAGSRAANVMSAVADPLAVAGVIDINERRTGCFLPGVACETHPPSVLAGKNGIAIVLMNDAYRDEITRVAQSYATHVDILSLQDL